MRIDDKGTQQIIDFEGFVDVPYRCSAGALTIGHGVVIEGLLNSVAPFPYNIIFAEYRDFGFLTKKTALISLVYLVEKYMKELFNSPEWSCDFIPKKKPNQNQYNALASLVYNVGVNGLKRAKTFRHCLFEYLKTNNNIKQLEDAWGKFGYIKGTFNKSLHKRRILELNTFLS